MKSSTIEKMKAALTVYRQQLNLMEGVLGACNYIVVVGACTIARNRDGSAELSISLTPHQFNKETAMDIARRINGAWVWNAKEWYMANISAIETALNAE